MAKDTSQKPASDPAPSRSAQSSPQSSLTQERPASSGRFSSRATLSVRMPRIRYYQVVQTIEPDHNETADDFFARVHYAVMNLSLERPKQFIQVEFLPHL